MVGIILMALLGGLAGGVSRDVLVNQIPAALINPAYIFLCLGAGGVGYFLAYSGGQLFREGLFQFVLCFSLPWYAIAGAQTGIKSGLPMLGSLALAMHETPRRVGLLCPPPFGLIWPSYFTDGTTQAPLSTWPPTRRALATPSAGSRR